MKNIHNLYIYQFFLLIKKIDLYKIYHLPKSKMTKILNSKPDCTSYTFLVLFLYLTIQYYICEFQYTDYSKPKEGRYLKQYNFSIFLGVFYTLCTIFFILLHIEVLNQRIKDSVFTLFFSLGSYQRFIP